MKTIKILYTILFFYMALGSNFNLSALDKKINGTKTFKVEKNGLLDLKLNPGDINIKTWDKNEVVIKYRTRNEESVEEDLDIEQTGNSIIIRYDENNGWGEDLDFQITVPKNYNLNLRTTAGDIRIKSDLNGEVNASTSAGDIDLENSVGDLKLNTMGGDITTRNVNGKVKVNSQGGEIRIGNIKGNSASINTMGGDIRIKSIGSDASIKTYGGEIRVGDINGNANVVTYGGDISLGNVGGNVVMETYGGNLSLNSASGEVEANTNAGDITLKNVTGSIKARTNAGRIMAQLNPKENSRNVLKTQNGDITLYLPDNVKAEIEARIRIRGRRNRGDHSNKIKSEFEAKNYKNDKDENEINGSYIINGGGAEISLSTFNSNIIIRKLK